VSYEEVAKLRSLRKDAEVAFGSLRGANVRHLFLDSHARDRLPTDQDARAQDFDFKWQRS
jgi:hypothetical protein